MTHPPARASQWRGPTEHLEALGGGAGVRMGPVATAYLSRGSSIFRVCVGTAEVPPAQMAAFQATTRRLLLSLVGRSQPPICSIGIGRRAELQVELDPDAPGFAQPYEQLAHSAWMTVPFGDERIPVEVARDRSRIPLGALTIVISHVPAALSKQELPAAILAAAGYVAAGARCTPAQHNVRRPPPDTVLILEQKLGQYPAALGGGPDGGRMVLVVLPPVDDPLLCHLPRYLGTPDGRIIAIGVRVMVAGFS
jgi:hypothetical protein